MRHYPRYITLFFATALTLLSTLGGCTKIGEAIDCDQLCEEMQTCVDGKLDVGRCSDRCEDKADDNKLRRQLDQCTDCLDQNYSCGEIDDKCPICEGVIEELIYLAPPKTAPPSSHPGPTALAPTTKRGPRPSTVPSDRKRAQCVVHHWRNSSSSMVPL